jgi:dihydroorotase-like cyclic amidohydrolase
LRGKQVIDVRGLVVAPGFIDLHAHGQDLTSSQLQAQDGVSTIQSTSGNEKGRSTSASVSAKPAAFRPSASARVATMAMVARGARRMLRHPSRQSRAALSSQGRPRRSRYRSFV